MINNLTYIGESGDNISPGDLLVINILTRSLKNYGYHSNRRRA